ncbi:hypothetical protein B0H14DRAFT_2785817 [Mycena olivaceomarginata]|nr:hypothetical protein B0H14DRAFT_2785817 [Mycena olivaceomarginata]
MMPSGSTERSTRCLSSGQYIEAARCYEAAIAADTTDSLLYYSNLAATQLKLGQFGLAQSNAHTALEKDPKSLKARYRRALARRSLGKLSESLMDLATLLTIHPGHQEGSSAFAECLAAHSMDGGKQLCPAEIVAADWPHAFGNSTSTSGRSGHTICVNISAGAAYAPIPRHCVCDGCKMRMNRSETRYCSKCRVAMYCSVECQRRDWPVHKPLCNRPPDHNLTMRLGRTLMDHEYIGALLTLYAHRALGLFDTRRSPIKSLLMVSIHMVPFIDAANQPRKRLAITSILAVPLAILSQAIIECHAETERVQATEPERSLVSICVLPDGLHKECETRFRLFGPSLPVELLSTPNFRTTLRSPAFGVVRDVGTDLDSLFEVLQDELEFDTNNYYKLRT